MNLAVIAGAGILGIGAISVFSSNSKSSTAADMGTGGTAGTGASNGFDNNFLKGIMDNFNKPNKYNIPNKKDSGYNSDASSNNALTPKMLSKDLLVFKNSNNKIVGGISTARKQSLNSNAANLEANNINNPIVKISRSSSSSGHSSSSKKSINKFVGPIQKKDNTISNYETKHKVSTTLTKKQINSYHYLTGGF